MIVSALFLIVTIVIVISLLIATIASLIVEVVLVRHPVVALKSIITVASLEALAVTLLRHRLILQDGLRLGVSILSERLAVITTFEIINRDPVVELP